MYDLIIIGAGPGGYEAAAHAAKLGGKVALIEKSHVGGTCLNVGCIPTKAFLKSAKLYAEVSHGAALGIQAGNLHFDLPEVVRRKDKIVSTLTRGVAGMLKRAGVETITGEARLVAKTKVTVNDETLVASNILIATGSRPAVPKIPGLDSPAVLDSTAVLQQTRKPESIAIIGGGYIGLEFAGFFSSIGTKVTVLEMLPNAAAGCDRDIAKRLTDSLTKSGVAIMTNCRVTSVQETTIHYQDEGRRPQTIETEVILNATGRVPNVQNLGLERLSLDFDNRGIRTSDEGRTSVPGIWACGDVTGRRLLAHAATREGIVGVNNMFGIRDRIRYASIPAVIYTHPEVASVGYTEEELKAQGVEYKRALLPMSVAGRFLVENEGAQGVIKVLADKRHGEILGVHVAGDGASEFIVLAAAMMETGMRARDIDAVVFPHPTVSEALKAAILEVI